ncbi:hypothetical protein AB751O23_CI_00010, partial [Chlamydiales bacterium SCGC AB-751-O23]
VLDLRTYRVFTTILGWLSHLGEEKGIFLSRDLIYKGCKIKLNSQSGKYIITQRGFLIGSPFGYSSNELAKNYLNGQADIFSD